MLIGIDGNEANVNTRVGIGEYAFELLEQFERLKTQDVRFQIYLKTAPLSHMPKERQGWSYKIIGPSKLWTRIALPLRLFLEKPSPDVFFTPTHYGPKFSPVPVAISIMDLSFIHFPGLFNKKDLYQLTNWTKESAMQAKKIFTISNFSKDDIIKTYNVSEDKIIVTYPGIKQELSMEELKKKYKIDNPYILFVGTLQPRKNIERLIEAFAKIKDLGYKSSDLSPKSDVLNLVVIGKKGWLYEDILNAPKKFEAEKQVKFLDFVSDEDLPAFYKNAICFCLPSLYEGFGLPVLEAMQNNCPVLASNVSSLPEAGGDAAVYFNPEDADDIAEKLKEVVTNETLRKEMIEKGKAQIKKFSWEKAASETLSVLEELGNKT